MPPALSESSVTSAPAPAWREWLAVAALTVAFVVAAVLGQRGIGPCYDETLMVALGHLLWRSPVMQYPSPLMQFVFALSVFWRDVRFPVEWLAAANAEGPFWSLPVQAEFAHRFIFETNAALPLMRDARILSVCFTALLVPMVYFWGRRLSGTSGGIAAGSLIACCSPLIANAGIASTDTLGVVGMIAALWRYAAWRESGSTGDALAIGLATGLGVLGKPTALLVVPVVLVLEVARMRSPEARDWRKLAMFLLCAGAALYAMILLGYRGSPIFAPSFPPQFQHPWFQTHCRDWWFRPTLGALPQSFLWQLDFQAKLSAGDWPLYFCGAVRTGKIWWYYPLVMLLKTDELWLGISAIGAGLLLWRRPSGWEVPLGSAAMLLLFFTFGASRYMGVRYVLVLYPLIAVSAAPLGRAIAIRGRRMESLALGVVLAGLWGWTLNRPLEHVAAWAKLVHPPHWWFVDSNLDWGQSLPALNTWWEQHGEGRTVHLAYFGVDDPCRYEFPARFYPTISAQFWTQTCPREWPLCTANQGLEPGLYAVSVTLLMGQYGTPECLLPLREAEPSGRAGAGMLIFEWPTP